MTRFETGRMILADKPLGWTSADVVRKVRNIVGAKVGHAGTLDPLATGLLILCSGKFTKRIEEFMKQEKEYTGHLTLGSTTVSYDLENEPENFRPTGHLTAADVEAAAGQFTGSIDQVPPGYSALKKNGKRAYELARAGKPVDLQPRAVRIELFSVDASALPLVSFRVVCSTGTYIRSLAHDLGEALGCGAHLSKLVRTRIGSHLLQDALPMNELESRLRAERLEDEQAVRTDN